MNTPLMAKIRQHLERYIAGELSIGEFEDWFIPATWNMHQHATAAAVRLSRDIQMLLMERQNHNMDEVGLKTELGHLLPRFQEPRAINPVAIGYADGNAFDLRHSGVSSSSGTVQVIVRRVWFPSNDAPSVGGIIKTIP